MVLKDDNVSLERKKNYLKRIGIILRQMENIRKKLFELQDKTYQEFQSGLCPNINNIIGDKLGRRDRSN